MFPAASPFSALSPVLRLGAVGIAIVSLEELSRFGVFSSGGILDVDVQMTTRRWQSRVRAVLGVKWIRRVVFGLTVIRVLAAAALIAGAGVFDVARTATAVVALSTLLLRLESASGTHASGALACSTFVSCALGIGVGSKAAMSYSLGFVAGLSCLAYLVSGLRKLQEESWRGGAAVVVNSTTVMWGNRRSALLLRGRPRVALAICWVTMLVECTVPLALITPTPVGLILLGCALLLHVSIAIEMGLNCFVWPFVATYPAILYCSGWLHNAGI